ncbi:hypothetical protein KP509_28G000700 [Ceratopteris richardii]|uniref:Uncharacterized protein n=1 Tax=Ceratopteris richardii TaxID=49495 RepID=A0A8T2R9Y2_CERRI|nr:hypothetical protein KP509_28G000700 [Ceratopteris richardii]
MMEDGRTTPLSPRSSAPSSSKLTNRCMFFNGRSTMDTGFHVTQKIREYLSSEACRCFDCTRGYSRRLFETNGFDDSSPSLAGDDRPFFRRAAYMGKAYVQAFNESIAHGYASPVCPSRPDVSGGALNPTDIVHLEVLDQADKNNAPSSSDQLPTNPHQQLCQTAQNQSLTLTQLEREGGDQMEAVAAQTMDGTLLASTTEDIFDFLATDVVDGNSFPPYEHKRHLSAEFGAILLIQNAGNGNLMCEEPECEKIEQMALPMLVSAQDTDCVHDSKSFPPFEHADYLIAKIAEMLSRNAENGNSIFAEIEQMALPMPSSAQEADDVTKPREDRREATMFLNTDDEVNYDSIFNQQRCFNCGSKNCYDHKSCTYMGSMLTDQRNFADPTFW